MKAKSTRVIFDTNVWIGFLIGKRLSFMRKYIADGRITIIVTDQLLTEIKEVTKRAKLKKYFPEDSINELIEFLDIIAEKVEISPKHYICRDPKDNFLLDLIDYSKADYLVTGDKDLLAHNPFLDAVIVTSANFEKIFKSS